LSVNEKSFNSIFFDIPSQMRIKKKKLKIIAFYENRKIAKFLYFNCLGFDLGLTWIYDLSVFFKKHKGL